MQYKSLPEFLSKDRAALAKGPVALILVEDLVEVEPTVRHHILAGFKSVVVFGPQELVLPQDIQSDITQVCIDMTQPGATEQVVNAVIEAAPDIWIYYCYNAEFLFFPFCETRTISEMLAFHTEERRDAVLGYVVDLYASDLFASISPSVEKLVRFDKIFVPAGESTRVDFTLFPDDLSFVNSDLVRVVEPGEFSLRAGSEVASFEYR